MVFHVEEHFKSRRVAKIDIPQKSLDAMSPHLRELLQSANTDHVLKGGTGQYDFLISRLTQELNDQTNERSRGLIQAAIERLEALKEIDPIRVDTRNELRSFFLDALGMDTLDPKGPMEL